jgi:DNA-binding GntR family transcriptional regulator
MPRPGTTEEDTVTGPRISFIDRPESFAQQAYAAIRRAIQDRELVRDALYSENELAERMGISRTPVREALIELSREGLVEIVPQRGFRLRVLTPAEEREVFDLRRVLESHVAQRLARRSEEDHVEQLRGLLAEQADERDPQAFLAIDEQFHLLMPRLIGLERTHQMLLTLRGAMWLIGGAALELPARTPDVIAEHTEIVDAIEAGDARAAVRAAKRHIDCTEKALLRYRQQPASNA